MNLFTTAQGLLGATGSGPSDPEEQEEQAYIVSDIQQVRGQIFFCN